MRIAVYTDYAYHRIGEEVYAERAFALFLARLAQHFDRFTVLGKLAPHAERGRYPLGDRVDFVPLPYYPRLTEPVPVLMGLASSLRRFWTTLGDVDCVWLIGPHPFAFPFAALARLRGKRVVLGVRQNFPEYVRNRHPQSRLMALAAWALELGYRRLGRSCAVVAVGPRVAEDYRHAQRLLRITVSLVEGSEIVAPDEKRLDYDGELKVLSVGRLDPEKNTLMLADVLARLVDKDSRWRLIVCGEGSQAKQLESRLRELEVRDNAELRGYVAHDGGLKELYRESHVLLHVSWTEGLPQVLYEAFAAGLPVVATDVGGIRTATAGAVTLIPAGDPDAAVQALVELGENEPLRRHRIEAGHDLVSSSTIDEECRRVADFLLGEPLFGSRRPRFATRGPDRVGDDRRGPIDVIDADGQRRQQAQGAGLGDVDHQPRIE